MYQHTVLTQVALVQRLMYCYVLLTELASLTNLAMAAYFVFTLKKVFGPTYTVFSEHKMVAVGNVNKLNFVNASHI